MTPPLIQSLLLGVAALILLPAALGSDLVLNVSQDLGNSASRRFTTAGAFNVSGTLGASQVNTSILKALWPAVYAACPSCAFSANLTLAHAPYLTIDTMDGVLARVSDAQAQIFGMPAGSSTQRVALFDLSFNGSFGLTLGSGAVSSGGVIPVNITQLGLDIIGIDSQVGALTPGQKALLTTAMDVILSLLIKTVVLPEFTKDFPGLPIPVIKGVALSNLHVDTAPKHLGISVDIAVTPSRGRIDGGGLGDALGEAAAATPDATVTPPLPSGFSGPGLEIGVGLSGANKLIAGFLPALVASVKSTVIPAFSGKSSGVTFKTDATKISSFAIGAVKLQNLPGQGLALTLSGLTLAIPSTGFEVSKKIIVKLHCSGHFSGSLSGASVVLPLNITANAAGKPQITAPKSTWNFGDLKVTAKMTHNVCVLFVCRMFHVDLLA